MTLRFILLFLSVGLFTIQARDPAIPAAVPPPAPKPNFTVPDDIEFLQDVVYGQGGGRPLHAYVFYPKKPAALPMPGVILIHGGGWEKGTHAEGGGIEYAKAGYFVASIEYRLSGEAKWPAQLEDCKLAVRWLRANAAKYHVDPNRIAAVGGSAGGHLAACLGTMADLPLGEGQEYPDVSSRVMAVVDLMGPVDFTRRGEGIGGTGSGKDAPLLLKLFGVSSTDQPDTWRQASPIVHVNSQTPPFLIIHGDSDQMVPYSQSLEFVAALEKAGVPVELVTIKGGGHNLKSLPGQPPAEPGYQVWWARVKAFLEKNLK